MASNLPITDVVTHRKPILRNRKSYKSRRQELRNHGTTAEAVLWKNLQRWQVLGKKFRRQQSIGPYIVDFYCPECRLIVELDGAPHFELLADAHEAARTKYLQSWECELFDSKTG